MDNTKYNIDNMRAFQVTHVPATNNNPSRVKLKDLRFNKSIILNYGPDTPDNGTELAVYSLAKLGNYDLSSGMGGKCR